MSKFKRKVAPSILTAIDRLNYDFTKFEIEDFLSHLAHQRGRQIVCQGAEFENNNIFGVWISTADTDYIVYNLRTYYIHRIHIILHEVGHMVLEHPTISTESLKSTTNSADVHHYEPGHSFLPRLVTDKLSNEYEREAEDFATEIQSRILRANRLDYLIGNTSSIGALTVFTNEMGFGE